MLRKKKARRGLEHGLYRHSWGVEKSESGRLPTLETLL